MTIPVTVPRSIPRQGWRRYLHQLWLLTQRNLRVRYSTSLLGYLWSIVDPLVMALIYWFVFTQVLNRGGSIGHDPYIVFLLAGLLPWMWFNGAISDSTRAFWKEGKLVRSVKIPRTIWVNQLVLAKAIEFVASLPVLLVFAAFSAAVLHWQAVFVIPALLLQAALTVGVGLIVAPLVVFFRDLDRVTKLILRFLFYASPIIYSAKDLPEAFQFWAAFNPLTAIFSLYRSAFFPEELDAQQLLIGAGMTALLLVTGILVFRRSERALLKEI